MMFSKKNEGFTVKVEELTKDIYAEGVATITDDKAIFKDANTLSTRFQKVRNRIKYRRDPWAFVVYSGMKDEDGKLYYFTGNVVDKVGGGEGLDFIVVPKGTYAKITVEKKLFTGWTTRAAKARKYLNTQWLQENGYRLTGAFQDMDYYDVKSRVKPPSMDIYFPIEKI